MSIRMSERLIILLVHSHRSSKVNIQSPSRVQSRSWRQEEVEQHPPQEYLRLDPKVYAVK